MSIERAQRRLTDLERGRTALLDRLEPVAEERLHRSPGEGRWSVSQIVCHVARAEELALDYVGKKLQDPSGLPEAGWRSAGRLLMLAVALRSPLRVRSPPRAAEIPDDEPLTQTRQRWDAIRSGWSATIAAYPPELLGKAIFRHSYVGRLSLDHTLGFMAEHFEHHRKQIDRLLSG